MFPTTIAGSLPKPAWLAEPNRLWRHLICCRSGGGNGGRCFRGLCPLRRLARWRVGRFG